MPVRSDIKKTRRFISSGKARDSGTIAGLRLVGPILERPGVELHETKYRMNDYIVSLKDVGMSDVATVGGKNASLGEMIRHLDAAGVRVPRGFATTADAYRDFISID